MNVPTNGDRIIINVHSTGFQSPGAVSVLHWHSPLLDTKIVEPCQQHLPGRN
ncbi:hypothetical protein ZHAS_00018209 [Anopheles sinensis]|uniref:Uncharacterized protein n=1 Tax=Anopheles sinensis TaxID=74873 RepID=A0A084WIV4_ANOSI|nr:hypothetical protein ZHAS_00018209 [Anopheles sinensis]